ncbi:MAG: DUF3179 domain-containing protein [Pseudomonadota bacterium]
MTPTRPTATDPAHTSATGAGESRRSRIAGHPFQTTRRRLLAGAAATVASTGFGLPARAASDSDLNRAIWSLLAPRSAGTIPTKQAFAMLSDANDMRTVPGLIIAARFGGRQAETQDLLTQITGETGNDGWFDWMLWQEANPEVEPLPGYIDMKRRVYLSIDRNFEAFLRPEHLTREAARIRIEEITWGGVRKDGIPSLDNPNLIAASDADYLRDDDKVFGVSINGDTRAYPLRIMGWHEMFNEVIGGVPVALAYCTLCGAGILFETQLEGRAQPLVFGSSGFLYRSNKLMFDRASDTLWNQFTGEPVIGPLAQSGITLKQRPVAVASWADWRAVNPDTRVLSLNTGHRRDYGSGVVYRDYFASRELMFPALVDQSILAQKDYIFGIRQFGAAKAWPLAAFARGRVINDRIGDMPIVLVGDADGRTVRAYERGRHEFADRMPVRNGVSPGLSQRGSDAVWMIEEEGLRGPGGETMPRVAGHVAYWFAWNNYLGFEAELYSG